MGVDLHYHVRRGSTTIGHGHTSSLRKGTGNRYTIEVFKSEEEFDRHEESFACVFVVLELKRPDPRDRRVVEGKKLMAYLFASNTNVQHLGGEDVLIAVA